MSDYQEFAEAIRSHFKGENADRARAAIDEYYNPSTPYSGAHFERIADTENPNEITARDIVAVSMLSVEIPPKTSIWLLSDEGREQVGSLLRQVPADARIGDGGDHLAEGSPLAQLWELLGTAAWPHPTEGNGMGKTKKSKILAAKRPALVPVLDSVVVGALPIVDSYWNAFEFTFDEETTQLASSVTSSRPESVPVLRAVDVVLWTLNRHR